MTCFYRFVTRVPVCIIVNCVINVRTLKCLYLKFAQGSSKVDAILHFTSFSLGYQLTILKSNQFDKNTKQFFNHNLMDLSIILT